MTFGDEYRRISWCKRAVEDMGLVMEVHTDHVTVGLKDGVVDESDPARFATRLPLWSLQELESFVDGLQMHRKLVRGELK